MNSSKTVIANFELIIIDEVTAEAAPDQANQEETEETEVIDEILDLPLPEAGPAAEEESLPQTGGLPFGVVSLFGTALTGFGVFLKKRK